MAERIHNLHVPLPDEIYRCLRDAAGRSRRSMSEVAREAIGAWIRVYQQNQLHREIVEYATVMGGSASDLDEALEGASILSWDEAPL